MAGNYRVKIVVLVAVFVLRGETVTGNEPFISLACDNGLFVSPTDEHRFNEIGEFEDAIDSAYDPVNEKIYLVTDAIFGYVDSDGANLTVQAPLGCDLALGIEDGRIPNNQLTATSKLDDDAYKARLNGQSGWNTEVETGNEYIEVVLNRVQIVTGVITQGGAISMLWVKSYEVDWKYGDTWQTITKDGLPKLFLGNIDGNTTVTNMFQKPVLASAIRIRPKDWEVIIYLRMEILGCDANNSFLGITYNYETDAGLKTSTISRLNVASGRLYERSNVTDSEIAVFNAANSRKCSYSYTFADQDDQDFEVQAADVDICGRTLYWLQKAANKSKILSRHLDDFYGSTIETLYYGDNAGYDVNDIQIHNGSVYFVHTSDGPGGNILSRLSLTGGEPEALQCLANVSACNGIYIFDPTPPPPCEPIPYLLKADIPVIMGRLWRGGFIAHMDIHITAPLSDWRIEIYFPNRVYELEIEGCDAKVLEKHDVNRANFEKGTTWVLIPGPKSTSLDIGDKIRVKFIGKTNPTRRGFIRDVFAKFYRLPVVPSCD